MTETYSYTQVFTVLQKTTVGAVLEAHRAKLQLDEPFEGQYVLTREGDYPLRIEGQWPWLRRQQPSMLVTLLVPSHQGGSYASSTSSPVGT